MFRLILGIEMVEVAEELVEAVHGRQEFVSVAKMVLAELSGGVPLRLEKFGDGRILCGQPFLRSRQTHLQKSGPQRTLSGDECRAARGAGLLSIIIGEYRALIGDAVDVGRAVAHHAAIVGADVPIADIVGHDDKDVGLLRLLCHSWRQRGCCRCQRDQPWPDFPCKSHPVLLLNCSGVPEANSDLIEHSLIFDENDRSNFIQNSRSDECGLAKSGSLCSFGRNELALNRLQRIGRRDKNVD